MRGDDVDQQLAEVDRLAAHPMGTIASLVHGVTAWTRGMAAGAEPDTALQHLKRISLPLVQHLAAIDRITTAVRAGQPALPGHGSTT